MFSSTIIATVGRASLQRAVTSVLEQEAFSEDHEIVVVNDSGRPLHSTDWLLASGVRLLETPKRERSVARNAGAAIARGDYLHFLDDDDWIAPDAISTIWELASIKSADWLYGSTRLVDGEGRFLIELQHHLEGNCFIDFLGGEWIPLQASWIRADVFHEHGGFDQTLSGPEDIDLLRRISMKSDVAGTSHTVAYVVRDRDSSTTDIDVSRNSARRAREEILQSPEAFGRMLDSADTAYRCGRVVRAYATSVIWNVLHRRLFRAISRVLMTVKAFLLQLPSVPSRHFWRALGYAYQSPTFEQGFKRAAGKLQSTKPDQSRESSRFYS